MTTLETHSSPSAAGAGPSGSPVRRRRGWSHNQPIAYLFLLPTFFLLTFFLIMPIGQSFWISTYEWDGLKPAMDPVGLENWRELMVDGVFWKSVQNSVIVAVFSLIVQIPVALALAILLDRGGNRFRVFKVAFFFPLLMSSVAIAFLFQGVYDVNFGLINALLEQSGLQAFTQDWLGDPNIAIWSVVAVVSWQYIPFYMLLFLATLQGIPLELREAALLDGAKKGQYSRFVQLPLLRGAIATASLLIVIGSLKYFDLIWVMTGGGPDHATSVMATYMYEMAFKNNRVGYGSTIASALFIIVFATAMLVNRLNRPREGS